MTAGPSTSADATGAAGLLLPGLAGPVSGVLIDRVGVRRVAVGSMLVTEVGMGGTALAQELWQLVLLVGLVAGFGAGLVTSSLGTVVANRWFVQGRGAVLGLTSVASPCQVSRYP
jgi:MFS family permease